MVCNILNPNFQHKFGKFAIKPMAEDLNKSLKGSRRKDWRPVQG